MKKVKITKNKQGAFCLYLVKADPQAQNTWPLQCPKSFSTPEITLDCHPGCAWFDVRLPGMHPTDAVSGLWPNGKELVQWPSCVTCEGKPIGELVEESKEPEKPKDEENWERLCELLRKEILRKNKTIELLRKDKS